MKKIGIVGAGLIGSSWAAIFASKGFEVYVYDKDVDVFKNFVRVVFLKKMFFNDHTHLHLCSFTHTHNFYISC